MKTTLYSLKTVVPMFGLLFLQQPAFSATELPQRLGDLGLLKVGANLLAKEMCSCLWVLKKPEAFCKIYTHQSDVAAYVINWKRKEVYTTIKQVPFKGYQIPVPTRQGYGLDAQTAEFRGPRYGCVLKH